MSQSEASSDQNNSDAHQKLVSIWNNIKKTRNISENFRRNSNTSHNQGEQHLNQRKFNGMTKEFKSHGKVCCNHMEIQQKLAIAEEKILDLEAELQKGRANVQGRFKENSHDENKKDGKKDKQVERLKLKIFSLEREIKEKDEQLKQMYENNKMKESLPSCDQQTYQGAQLLQLNEAHTIIERLTYLLSRTKEYKNSSILQQELKNSHILKNINQGQRQNIHSSCNKLVKTCVCSGQKINQKLLWTPFNCYKIMLELKMKYDSLTESCIEQVLFQLNKIYILREDQRVQKLKESHQQQMEKLKKKMNETYNQILAKKQIMRLKKQLKTAQVSKKPPSAESKFTTFKKIGQYEDQFKLKQKQIRLLQERIKILQIQSGDSDKSLFYQGILWIIDKILIEIEMNESNIKEFEVAFRAKLEHNIHSEDWLRSYKEFFETFSELNNQLIQRVLLIKEGALNKAGTT